MPSQQQQQQQQQQRGLTGPGQSAARSNEPFAVMQATEDIAEVRLAFACTGTVVPNSRQLVVKNVLPAQLLCPVQPSWSHY
jgi:hypothetical protein